LLTAAALLAGAGCRQSVRVTGEQNRPAVEAPPYLSWPDEPVFEEVPDTTITWMKEYNGKMVGPDYDICRVGERWYWPHKGSWFVAKRKWRGPWRTAKTVPDEFLKIPKDHPLHRVVKLHPKNRKPQ
jgi:hypothetical protein